MLMCSSLQLLCGIESRHEESLHKKMIAAALNLTTANHKYGLAVRVCPVVAHFSHFSRLVHAPQLSRAMPLQYVQA
jgi:hypothetical protein